jgi:aryl-alcohol dehydrogenase-like predicted oxidoreductase
MLCRTLGGSGLEASVVGLGTWQWCGVWGEPMAQKQATALMARARELGVNLVDTAECYGDHVSESLLGKAIAGQRQDWLVATKFGHVPGSDAPEADWQPDSVRRQLEASLKALNTDYIDIYQFHSGSDAQLDNEALWEMLHRQREAGVIRCLGVSIGNPGNVWQAQRAAELGADVIQVTWNCLQRKAGEAVLPACRESGLGVINRTPLASGFLGGRYAPGARWPENDVRSMRRPEKIDEELDKARAIIGESVPEGQSPAAWALAWCLKNPAITSVIPGSRTLEQLEDSVRAVELLDG